MLFGTSKNLGTAICIRLAMGLFNGAVGVARGAVQNITDPSNEGRAFTLMGLCWGESCHNFRFCYNRTKIQRYRRTWWNSW